MSEQFKVGDIVELCNMGDDCCGMNGAEATIVDGPTWFGIGIWIPVYGYLIDSTEEKSFFVFPHEMRKRRPPQTDTGEKRIRELFDKPPVGQPELEPA